MKKISVLKFVLGLLFLTASAGLSASAQQVDCTKTTDADLATTIMAAINAKYPDLAGQVNAHVKDGVVYLEGWVANKSARKDIEKIAKKTPCVKKVKSNIKKAIGGGCGSGTKKCGDICIPLDQTCNISKGS